jgi:putative FmdB family regulatory protein
MPIYEYECSQCGARFERMQRFTDPPVEVCPECQGSVHRLIHPVGIVFKGSGWYVTDSRGKSSTLESGNGKGEEKKKAEESPSSPSSESKPAKGDA